jgi:hypothetical protein
MTGKTVSQHCVREKLGGGGMAIPVQALESCGQGR